MNIKTRDGFTIDFDFKKAGNKVVVFCHGMTVERSDEGIFVKSSNKLNELGLSTLMFDFRAHGKSTGNPAEDFTISGELLDLETILEVLNKKGFEKINVAGASFGGSIASIFAEKHPEVIDRLLLINPVLDYEKAFLSPNVPWAKKYFSDYEMKLKEDGKVVVGSRSFELGTKIFDEMKIYFPYKELEKFEKDLLIIHGTKDTKVSYEDTLEIFNNLSNQNKKFVTIEGSEHGFHEEPFTSEVVSQIVNFFK